MKALTVRQPWASLIATGVKRVETRSWSTKHRGLLAIHAALGFNKEEQQFALTPCIRGKLTKAGVDQELPRGGFVALVDLIDCIRVEKQQTAFETMRNFMPREAAEFELQVGYFAPGRYMWILDNIRPIPYVPARGQQGLWTAKPPHLYTLCVFL